MRLVTITVTSLIYLEVYMRKYGFLLVFFTMWIGSTVVHWTTHRDAEQHEAKQQAALVSCVVEGDQHACQEFSSYDETEFRNEFWRDYFENHQSEYAQLLFQGLVLIALANHLATKESENVISDVKDAIREMKEEGEL